MVGIEEIANRIGKLENIILSRYVTPELLAITAVIPYYYVAKESTSDWLVQGIDSLGVCQQIAGNGLGWIFYQFGPIPVTGNYKLVTTYYINGAGTHNIYLSGGQHAYTTKNQLNVFNTVLYQIVETGATINYKESSSVALTAGNFLNLGMNHDNDGSATLIILGVFLVAQ